MDVASRVDHRGLTRFEHQAVFYEGPAGLADAVVPFVRAGVERGEPVLVALPPDRIAVVERELGADSACVDFVDMQVLGANPARIIPEWRRFLEDTADGGPVRGVAEPVWAGRRDAEIAEAVLHEALLNVAFERGPAWQLMCPYDASALPDPVLAEAVRSHPLAAGAGAEGAYTGSDVARRMFSSPLPAVPEAADRIPFGADDLSGLRSVVGRLARCAGVGDVAADDLVLAAHELATNSILHGGGSGVLRAWSRPDAFVVEVGDRGVIEDLLVGRDMLEDLAENGRGIWMANQLCDLVQVRSGESGTAVRLFAWL